MTPSTPLPSAFPPRALARWAKQHLRCTTDAQGEVEALFRLEGSTCGNVPLVMLYRVHLGPREAGWPVRGLAVAPAPHDDGHRQQCSYRADSAAWSEVLATELPGLGRTLADAVAWAPPSSPAGCLCTSESRAHKWRIVFHTLHYALRTEGPPAL